MKSILKIIAVNFLVLFFLLLVVEIVLRLAGKAPYSQEQRPDITVIPGGKYFQKDPILGYKHLAGEYTVRLQDQYEFITSHNSNTLRKTSEDHAFSNSAKGEIWIFGCSFTHGWAINDHETFAWRLQAKLNDYKVVNWGVSGYGTIHFLLQMEKALSTKNNAELIILNHADFHLPRNVFSFNRRRTVSKWNALGSLNQPFAQLSTDNELIIKHSELEYRPWGLSKLSATVFYLQRKYEAYLDRKINSKSEEITGLILDKIVRLCQENETELILTNIGEGESFIEHYAGKKNLPFIDISVNTGLKEYNNLPYDPHPNARANELYYEKLYKYLTENHLATPN